MVVSGFLVQRKQLERLLDLSIFFLAIMEDTCREYIDMSTYLPGVTWV